MITALSIGGIITGAWIAVWLLLRSITRGLRF